jgi:hypothetical protein
VYHQGLFRHPLRRILESEACFSLFGTGFVKIIFRGCVYCLKKLSAIPEDILKIS